MNYCSVLRMRQSLIMHNVTRIFMSEGKKNLSEARNLQRNVRILHHIIDSVLKAGKSISYPLSFIFLCSVTKLHRKKEKRRFVFELCPTLS